MKMQANRKKLWGMIGVWALAGLTAAALFLYSSLTFVSAEAVRNAAAGMTGALYKTVFMADLSDPAMAALTSAASVLLPLCGFALLALFVWWALRLGGIAFRRTVFLSLGISVIYAAGVLLYQMNAPGRYPSVTDIAVDLAGIALSLLCVLLGRLLWVKCPRVYNWETISYVIFGVLTTLVNIIVFGIFANNYGMGTVVSNTIAWVFAVIFAYVVNKLFVFHSHNHTARQVLREFGLFIGARLLSLGVDDLGMWLLVDILHVNNGVSKILMNIIVMIMNYFFSKWIIFKKAEE